MKKIIQSIWIFCLGMVLSAAFLAPEFTNAQNIQPSLAPTVYTGGATNITKNSAVFSGSVNSSYDDYWAWFEYSTSDQFINTSIIGYESHSRNVSVVSAELKDLRPSTTYYYRMVAQNQYGAVKGGAMSFKTQSSALGMAPLVFTNPVSSISNNSVTLSGTVNPNYNYTTAWFEYGTSYQFEYIIGYQGVGSWGDNRTVYAYLQNLSPNITYYFRIAAQNSQGTSYGSILTFTNQLTPSGTIPLIPPAASNLVQPTQPNQPTQPSIFNFSSTVKKSAPKITNETIFLNPLIDNQNPSAGQEITYILNYKNIGKSFVKNASLKIVLSGEVQYQSSNLKAVSTGNNLSFNLGAINSQEQGTVNVKVKIKNLTRGGSALMFAATLNYNDLNGNPRSVDSYLAVVIKESTSVAASLLDVIGSLVNSLFFDLLLGLALGYGIYNFFVRSKDTDLAG
ncbi:fibronectin type III domain-containing protein [Candidatus Wolfebacteria bacterium]|nr:fibronectin type III domain-containing protein [Candidatus Wolfebacteria bacterium]